MTEFFDHVRPTGVEWEMIRDIVSYPGPSRKIRNLTNLPNGRILYFGSIRSEQLKERSKMTLDRVFCRFVDRCGSSELKDIKRRLLTLGSIPVAESLRKDEELYMPARQNFDALLAQVAKFDQNKDFVLPDRWKDTVEMFKMRYDPIMSGTFLADDSSRSLLDLSKSCGPVFRMAGYETKQSFEDDPSALGLFEQYWRELAEVGGGWTLCGSNLKDELRPVSKITENKTRQIFPCSILHFYAGVRLFYGQSNRLKQARKLQSIKVGLSRFGSEYSELIGKFFGKNVGACDGSGWDRVFPWFIHLTLGDLRFSWLCPSDQTTDNYMRILNWYLNVQYKYILLSNGDILIVTRGQTSGNYLTLDDNSLYHELQFMNIFLRMTNIDINDPYLFRKYDRDWFHVVLGDDSMFTAPVEFDAFMRLYNEFLDHEDFGAWQDVLDTAFCCQQPIRYRNGFVATPSRLRTISSMFWKRKGLSRSEGIIRILQLRVHGYFLKDVRELVDKFYSYVIENEGLSDIEMDQIAGSFLTHEDIIRLYTGVEPKCVSMRVKDVSRIERFISYNYETND